MTFLEAQTHLARKLNINLDDIDNNDLWTDADIETFVQLGLIKAWDFKLWPFTRKAKTATSIDADYYDYPDDLVLGSAFLLKVAGKEYKKLSIEDYLKFLEDYPTATDKIWSETETFLFINKNAYTIGDPFDVYGKKYAPSLEDDDALLPFSPVTDNNEHSGNEAIVQLSYAEALDSEKLKNPAQAEIERKKAYQTLELLWRPFAESKALMQSKNRPMFNAPDFLGMPNSRSSANTGNFNYLN